MPSKKKTKNKIMKLIKEVEISYFEKIGILYVLYLIEKFVTDAIAAMLYNGESCNLEFCSCYLNSNR